MPPDSHRSVSLLRSFRKSVSIYPRFAPAFILVILVLTHSKRKLKLRFVSRTNSAASTQIVEGTIWMDELSENSNQIEDGKGQSFVWGKTKWTRQQTRKAFLISEKTVIISSSYIHWRHSSSKVQSLRLCFWIGFLFRLQSNRCRRTKESAEKMDSFFWRCYSSCVFCVFKQLWWVRGRRRKHSKSVLEEPLELTVLAFWVRNLG